MSNDGESTDWIERLNDISTIDSSTKTSDAFTRLLFLPIIAFFAQLADLTEAIFDLVITPLETLADGSDALITNLIGSGDGTGAAGIIADGVSATSGDISLFGIVGFPASILIALGGLILVAVFLSRDETSDILPGTFTDLPIIGVDEDEE